MYKRWNRTRPNARLCNWPGNGSGRSPRGTSPPDCGCPTTPAPSAATPAPVIRWLIPVELEKMFVAVEHSLPDREQLLRIARELTSDSSEDLPKGEAP